ncbi:uncharacterized protein LOC143850223 [Tasmannia lanceolata]|uniref:uncharacterized protein LOC143850223 n=1 Tax=Tasmannia lanceolata TaxID=3420 RepID=UPI004063D517
MSNKVMRVWISESIRALPRERAQWSTADRFISTFNNLSASGVNWQFLQAAARLWDPILHVFQFGPFEICPIFEDWCALLELPPEGLWIQPSSVASPRSLFCKLFENQTVDAMPYFKDTYVQFDDLIERFSKNVDPIDTRFQNCRRSALIFGVLARHVVREDSSIAPVTLLSVVDQISEGRNPVPLMLAETFSGLDLIARQEVKDNFHGCVKLLYLWLCEKLTILRPQSSLQYTLKDHLSWQPMANKPQSIDEWRNWLQHVEKDQFHWVSHSCLHVITSTCPHPFVYLMGLEKSTFYAPTRLLYQITGSPCPPGFVTPPPCEKLTPDLIKSIVTAWGNKVTARRFALSSKVHRKELPEEPAGKRARIMEH